MAKRYKQNKKKNNGEWLHYTNNVARMPQDVKMVMAGDGSYGDDYRLNDDIKGVDVQMKDDAMGIKRKKDQKYPEKY